MVETSSSTSPLPRRGIPEYRRTLCLVRSVYVSFRRNVVVSGQRLRVEIQIFFFFTFGVPPTSYRSSYPRNRGLRNIPLLLLHRVVPRVVIL